jgi:hypothetical protein
MHINSPGDTYQMALISSGLNTASSGGKQSKAAPIKEAETMQMADIQALESTNPRSVSSHIMSGDYDGGSYKRSKYIQAQLDSHKAEKTFSNKINSLIEYLKTGIGENRYIAGLRIKNRASQLTEQIINAELSEDFEQQLEASRESNAQEADENTSQEVQSQEPAPDAEGSADPALNEEVEPDSLSAGGAGGSVDITV